MSSIRCFYTVLLFAIGCFCLESCKAKYFYEAFEYVPNQQWNYTDSLQFEVELADTNSLYNFYVLPRHTIDFPYMNLWVKIKTIYPNGDKREQRVEIPMADKTGKWFGKGVAALKLNEVSIIQNVKLQQIGKYKFSIVQDMRYEPIKEIRDFGFRIEKLEEK